MFWIALFFIVIYGLIIWLIPGIVGGTITAFAIKLANVKVDFTTLTKIALGWTAGMVIGGTLGLAIYSALLEIFNTTTSLIISFGITGMVTSLIGSSTTCKLLNSLTVSEQIKAG